MQKNVASQTVSASLASATDGSNVTTGTTTVYVTGDAGTQASGTGTVTHEGQGSWSYVPTQAETNYDQIAFTFVNSLAVSQTANVYTIGFDPHANLPADMVAISGDTPAADNLEATYDGTGYTDPAAPASQAQFSNLAVGTAAISKTAEGFTKSGAEPETNDYTATFKDDGISHIVEDDGGTTDAYYEFNIGGTGIPVSVVWKGYAQSKGDDYAIYAYNFGATTWEEVGSIAGANGTTLITEPFSLTASHVGMGADLGLVRWRFQSTNGTAFATDRLLCSFAVVQSSLGFVGGAVWVDTVNGEAGTTEGIGQISRPVDNITDAKTIADNNNIRYFHCMPESTFTLAEAFDNYRFDGYGYTVNLGGQSMDGTQFTAATIVGDDSGTNIVPTAFRGCLMSNNSLSKHDLALCGLSGTITLTEARTYDWTSCYIRVDGTATPVVDFGGALGATNLNMPSYSGEIEVQNMGATDMMTLSGNGHLIINANCTGGDLTIQGSFTRTDNSGSVTIHEDARYDVFQINTQVDTGISDAGLATATALSAVDGKVDDILTDTGTTIPATLAIIDGKLTTVGTNVDGIKTKTDALTFTITGNLDANIRYVNDVRVTGDGTLGNEWGPNS